MPINLSDKQIKSNLEFLKEHLSSNPTAVDGLYQLPKNLSDDVIKTNFSQSSLQKISDHIGYFLGILKSVKINFVEETADPRWIASNTGILVQGNEESSTPGIYKVIGYDHSEIVLIKKYRYQLQNLLAILAHEYTHHYLHEHRVKKDNVSENEILTEIATAFLGIGQLLIEGYQPITWTSDYYNYVLVSGSTVHTMTLGYVTPATIKKAIILATELRHWNPKEVVKSFGSLFDKLSVYIKLDPYRREIKKNEKHRKKIIITNRILAETTEREKREIIIIKKGLSEIKVKYKNICLGFNEISQKVNPSLMSKEDGESFIVLANEVSQGNIENEIDNLLRISEDINKFSYIKEQKNQLMNNIIKWQILLDKYLNVSKK